MSEEQEWLFFVLNSTIAYANLDNPDTVKTKQETNLFNTILALLRESVLKFYDTIADPVNLAIQLN